MAEGTNMGNTRNQQLQAQENLDDPKAIKIVKLRQRQWDKAQREPALDLAPMEIKELE